MTLFWTLLVCLILAVFGWHLLNKLINKFPKYRNLVFIGFARTLLISAIILFVKPWLLTNNYTKNESIITVGISADFPPFTYIENDEIVGFEIDLIKEVGKRLEKEIIFKNMPFGTLLPALQLGQLDVLAAGLTTTPERAKHVLFTTPYLDDNPLVIVSMANVPILTVADLAQKEVIVNEGYTADLYLSKIDGIKIKRLKTAAEAFLALKTGHAVAFVTAQDTVAPFFELVESDKFNIAVIPDTKENASFAIAPQYPDLLKIIQEALDQITQDGTLKTIKEKWKLS